MPASKVFAAHGSELSGRTVLPGIKVGTKETREAETERKAVPEYAGQILPGRRAFGAYGMPSASEKEGYPGKSEKPEQKAGAFCSDGKG